MVGEFLDGYVCPECGSKVIEDGFDDWNSLSVKCHCDFCDWKGTEDELVEEEEEEED